MSAQKDVDRWTGAIADLQEQRDKLEAERVKAEVERKATNLGRYTGDRAAAKRFGRAKERLGEIDAQLHDLALAIGEAQLKLEAAEAEVARQVKAEVARKVSGLADQRIALAPKIEVSLKQAAELIEEYETLGREIAVLKDYEGGTVRRLSSARIYLIFQRLFGSTLKIGTGQSDPRYGKSLEHLEIEAMGRFVLSQKGVERRAA